MQMAQIVQRQKNKVLVYLQLVSIFITQSRVHSAGIVVNTGTCVELSLGGISRSTFCIQRPAAEPYAMRRSALKVDTLEATKQGKRKASKHCSC